MAEKPTPKAQSQSTDITRTGTTPPSASSRPIIVGNRPMVHDPMLNETENETTDNEDQVIKNPNKKVISPIRGDDDPENELSGDDIEGSNNETQNDVLAMRTQDAASDSEAIASRNPTLSKRNYGTRPTESKNNSKNTSTSAVDAVVGQAKKDRKDNKDVQEIEKRLKEAEKLIAEKKYFVPIRSTSQQKRRTRWVALLLMVVMFAVAYLAIDAQIINNNIWLPYEFFKEKQAIPDVQSSKKSKVSENDSTDSTISDNDEAAPKEYLLYSNKALGFQLTYPIKWLNNGDKEISVEVKNIDDYVLELDSNESPVFYDKSHQKWYRLIDGRKNYLSIEDVIEAEKTVDDQKFTLFTDVRDGTCHNKWLNFIVKDSVVSILVPNVCDENVTNNSSTTNVARQYSQQQFQKDMDKVIGSYKTTGV